MAKDLDPRHDRPSWKLASYGPAKYQRTLISIPDTSFEEMRMKAVNAAKEGKLNDYVSDSLLLGHRTVQDVLYTGAVRGYSRRKCRSRVSESRKQHPSNV